MLLVVRVGNMGGRICSRFEYLPMAFWKSGKPGQDVCLVFKTNFYCVFRFVFVMIDCIFVSECQYRLIDELGFVLQLGKIVASIEQKPVSLNDIVTCRAPIKNESDY